MLGANRNHRAGGSAQENSSPNAVNSKSAVTPGASILGLRSGGEPPRGLLPQLPSHRFEEAATRAAVRVINILDYFSTVQRPIRASEAASDLNLPTSTAHDLLQSLVDTGFVSFNEKTKCYFPSLRLARFGNWLTKFYCRGSIMAAIEKLKHATGETVGIMVPEAQYMRIVAHSTGLPTILDTREGLLLPMLDSASGCAFLMTQSDDEIIRILRKVSRQKLGREEVRVARFLELISSFRAQRYATVGLRTELVSAATPVYFAATDTYLMFAIGGSAERLSNREHELGKILLDIVEEFFGQSSLMACS